jgi:hypothetical protein
MFSQTSRYYNAGTYVVTLADGTQVTVTRIPPSQPPPVQGWHQRTAAERLDLLAFQYVGDPTAAWQLGWANDAVVLDALAAHPLIAIPARQ